MTPHTHTHTHTHSNTYKIYESAIRFKKFSLLPMSHADLSNTTEYYLPYRRCVTKIKHEVASVVVVGISPLIQEINTRKQSKWSTKNVLSI